MSDIEFDEDKSFLKPLPPEVKVPDKGFEGWFYKTVPGSVVFKKFLLLSIVLALFACSFILFALAKLNTDGDTNFEERVQKRSS